VVPAVGGAPTLQSNAPTSERVVRRRLLSAGGGFFALAMLTAGIAFWPGFSFFSPQHTPTGGLLFFQSIEPESVVAPGNEQSASISIDTWDAGASGVTIAAISMEFDHPTVGSKWFLVASGDLAVLRDRDRSLYCLYGRARTDRAGLACPASPDNPTIRFRFDDVLATKYEQSGALFGLRDLEGYDPGEVAVVQGIVPAPDLSGRSSVELHLPVARIAINSVGEEKRVSLPSLGFEPLVHYGQGDNLNHECSAAPVGDFLFSRECVPVRRLTLSALRLTMGADLESGYIEASSPNTVSDDELRWEAQDHLTKPQAVIADPYSRRSESIRAFIAALLFGGAGSALRALWKRLRNST